MGVDAVGAVLSRPTGLSRSGPEAGVCGDVLSRSTGHSLEEWVGGDAAGAVFGACAPTHRCERIKKNEGQGVFSRTCNIGRFVVIASRKSTLPKFPDASVGGSPVLPEVNRALLSPLSSSAP